MKAFSSVALAVMMSAPVALAMAQDGAQAGHGAHGEVHASAEAPAAAELTDGEVRKVDKEAGKITLRHGEIKNLNMAPMTMVLRVKDAGMLDTVQAGDKVRFAAERIGGAVTIVQMQKAE